MNLITNIIEPRSISLFWDSCFAKGADSYEVARIFKDDEAFKIDNDKCYLFCYLNDNDSFKEAVECGFDGYPSLPDFSRFYWTNFTPFVRRIMSRRRKDFPFYLESFGVSKEVIISDFSLLAYSGGRLLSDTFSFYNRSIEEQKNLFKDIPCQKK